MHLLQLGAGSGGMAVLDLVARDPRITRITLVEPDVYAPHNVYRHLFPPSAVGQLKAELAAEWVKAIRPDITFEALVADITDPARQSEFKQVAVSCDVGVCAADNEAAKYAFDALMRGAGKPWTLGEVLSGGIGGWVHRFVPGGACYGCVASHLQREVTEQPAGPPPDYSNPSAAQPETTIPATKASIAVIAGLHALVTLECLAGPTPQPPPYREGEKNSEGSESSIPSKSASDSPLPAGRGVGGVGPNDFTSLLFSLQPVPGVFDVAYRPHRLRIARSPTCLICGTPAALPTGEQLDAAVDDALARLGAR
ncbi:MAG: ThiF family adenylyltransferase [Planctomycetia bacterium]|nr:ThiF family adenylyltransferase [Planctomycetia bacterium]